MGFFNSNKNWKQKDLKPFPSIDLSEIWTLKRYTPSFKNKDGNIIEGSFKFDFLKHKESDENTPLLYIVFEYPNYSEKQNGLLSERNGSLIRYYLKQLNMTPINIIVGAAFEDYISSDEIDTATINQYCKPLFFDIIEKQPKTILCMGQQSLMAFNRFLKYTDPEIHNLRTEPAKRFVMKDAYEGDIFFSKPPKYCIGSPLDCLALHTDVARAVVHTVFPMEKYSKAINFKKQIVNVDSMEALDNMLSRFRENYKKKGDKYHVAFDTETKNLSFINGDNELLAISFSDSLNKGFCVLIDHKDAPWTDEEKPIVREKLGKWFENNKCNKIGFNSKFDINIIRFLLHKDNFEIRNVSHDVMLMQYLFDMHYSNKSCRQNLNLQKPNSLGTMARFWLQYGDETWYNMKDQRTVLSTLPGQLVYKYAAEDSILTYRLFKIFDELLKAKHPDTYNIALPTMKEENYAIAELEFNGALIDRSLLERLISESDEIGMNKLFKDHEQEFFKFPEVKIANEILSREEKLQPTLFGSNLVFNVKSNDHLITLFRDVMKLPVVEPENPKKKGKSENSYPTGKEFLDTYSETQPLVKLLKNLRAETKMIGFVKGFSKYIWKNNRVYPKFNLNGTLTGRLSCFNPNMQQLPRADDAEKGGLKHWIKRCFIAPPGYCLIAGDYSTAEVRGGALVTGDEKLSETFKEIKSIMEEYASNPTPELFRRIFINSEADAHKLNYSRAFGIPVSEVTKEQRQQAKGVTFQIMYSATPLPLISMNLGISIQEAERIVNSFLGKFPQLQQGLVDLDNFGIDNGFMITPYGKIRDIYEFFSGTEKDWKHAVNSSRNSPIQGFTSDTCLLGIRELLKYRRDNEKDWQFVNLVHDAAYFLVPQKLSEIGEFLEVAKEKLSLPPLDKYNPKLNSNFIPMAVDFEIGFNNCEMVHFDGTKQHLKLIYKWLKNGGDMKQAPEPGSYFEDFENLKKK